MMAETPPDSDGGARDDYSHDEVDYIVANRAIVEQAKGVLMYVHGVDADEAFQMLRSRARETRVKIRTLAEQILTDPTRAKNLRD